MLATRPRHLESSFPNFSLKLQSFITYNLGENKINDLSVNLGLRVVFLRSAFPSNKHQIGTSNSRFACQVLIL